MQIDIFYRYYHLSIWIETRVCTVYFFYITDLIIYRTYIKIINNSILAIHYIFLSLYQYLVSYYSKRLS